MIVIALLLATLFAIGDPVGDTAGDGSLRPPTSGIYAGSSSFDLLDVSLISAPNLTVSITMGALDNPGDLTNGFSNPVIEVYLDSREGGETELLPGSGMNLPEAHGWETAIRITGDLAEAHHLSDSGDRVRLPVEVQLVDGAIIAATPLAGPDAGSSNLFAVVGVYDPFSETTWRELSREASPWAFSSDSQTYPVVDLLAVSDEAQHRALLEGTLPLSAVETGRQGVPWLLLMALGISVALVGIALRSRVHSGATTGSLPAGPAATVEPSIETAASVEQIALPPANGGAATESLHSESNDDRVTPLAASQPPAAPSARAAGGVGAADGIEPAQAGSRDAHLPAQPHEERESPVIPDRADLQRVPPPAAGKRSQEATPQRPTDGVPVFVIGRRGRELPPSNTGTAAEGLDPSALGTSERMPMPSAQPSSGTEVVPDQHPDGAADSRATAAEDEPESVHRGTAVETPVEQQDSTPGGAGPRPGESSSATRDGIEPSSAPPSGVSSGLVELPETGRDATEADEGHAKTDLLGDAWDGDDTEDHRNRRWSSAWGDAADVEADS